MQDMDILTKELKEKVLEDENLKEATKSLKQSIESDIEGDFNAEAFNQLQRDRKSIMMAGTNSAETVINEAKRLKGNYEEKKDSDDFKTDRRRDTISNEDYGKLEQLMQKYKFLYQHFAGLFIAENQFNDKVMKAVELQRSRALEKQGLEIMKDNLPTVIEGAMDKGEEIKSLEQRIDDEVENVRDENERLKDRLEDLEKQVHRVRTESRNKQSSDESSSESASEETESVEESATAEAEEEQELTNKQEELLDLAEDESLDIEDLAEKMEWPEVTVKSQFNSIKKKNHDIPARFDEVLV